MTTPQNIALGFFLIGTGAGVVISNLHEWLLQRRRDRRRRSKIKELRP